MTDAWAGFVEDPDPAQLIDWLDEAPGGAIQIMVTRAKAPGLSSTPSIDPERLEKRARTVQEGDGVHRVVLIHATGDVEEGEPVAVVGATADHRSQTFDAVDHLLGLLAGVAQRDDLPV